MIQIENFFIDDKFYSDLEEVLEDCFDGNIDEVNDDWSVMVEMADLEPMFTLNYSKLHEMIVDNFEERFTEDGNEDGQILRAINECFDFEKFNSKIPKFYYPNSSFKIITKKELIEFTQ